MLINPRLTDFHGIHVPQHDLDFAIPFLDEDIPLYVDPFMLWKSPSHQDQSLHSALVNSFNHLGYLASKGKTEEAVAQLIAASECDEVGLGNSRTRKGKRIGHATAEAILGLFDQVPHYSKNGFQHFEEIQFFIDGISKDRVSDITCCFLKSFLIDFTMDQCDRLGIPVKDVVVENIYRLKSCSFETQKIALPVTPEDGNPVLLVPKRWLRHVPWINYDDYFRHHCPQDDIAHEGEKLDRVRVLTFNRENYGVVDAYIKEKERTQEDCRTDPLFAQIPVTSAKRHFAAIQKLNTGKENGADQKYEDATCRLLPSLLYPHLDFAAEQSRTHSGSSIRDLIFYNNPTHDFLKEILDDYGSRQIVFEMKNVAKIERGHIDQLNRYMTEELGRFGVLVTRHPLKKAEWKRTIDLWSGQRKCIIALTDADLAQMVDVFESKQRHPLDVLKKKYIEFRRACPM